MRTIFLSASIFTSSLLLAADQKWPESLPIIKFGHVQVENLSDAQWRARKTSVQVSDTYLNQQHTLVQIPHDEDFLVAAREHMILKQFAVDFHSHDWAHSLDKNRNDVFVLADSARVRFPHSTVSLYGHLKVTLPAVCAQASRSAACRANQKVEEADFELSVGKEKKTSHYRRTKIALKAAFPLFLAKFHQRILKGLNASLDNTAPLNVYRERDAIRKLSMLSN